jgi:hypothetical protein
MLNYYRKSNVLKSILKIFPFPEKLNINLSLATIFKIFKIEELVTVTFFKFYSSGKW